MKVYIKKNSIYIFDFTGKRVKEGKIYYSNSDREGGYSDEQLKREYCLVRKLITNNECTPKQICDKFITSTKYDLAWYIDRIKYQYTCITEDVHTYEEFKQTFLELLEAENFDNVVIVK